MVPNMSHVLSKQDVKINNIIVNTPFPRSDFSTIRNELIQSSTVFDMNNSDASNASQKWVQIHSGVPHLQQKELTIYPFIKPYHEAQRKKNPFKPMLAPKWLGLWIVELDSGLCNQMFLQRK